jgi:hypothetical protein
VNVNPKTPPATRFWAKVEKTEGCWLWTAATGGQMGYGTIGVTRTRMMYAHRLSWEMHHGPIPIGSLVLHHCDQPRCVRPDHLFLGTRADNMADMVAKGRQARGESHANARLTPDIVKTIRASGEGQLTIARRYKISQPTVSNIRTGRTWASVE